MDPSIIWSFWAIQPCILCLFTIPRFSLFPHPQNEVEPPLFQIQSVQQKCKVKKFTHPRYSAIT
jgi:hypothetical protein